MSNDCDIPPDYRTTIDGVLNATDVEAWDDQCAIPLTVLRHLSRAGLLCPQVPSQYGGLGSNSRLTGEITAYVGTYCSSVRSIMTSQGMAAWTIQRLGSPHQRSMYLQELTNGRLAAIAFSEAGAGSDLSEITTRIERGRESVLLNGEKTWITGARYADLLVVIARFGNDEAAAVIVPTAAEGVVIEPLNQPLGCRAGGHAKVQLNNVRLPAANVLGGCGHAMAVLITSALTFGRLSVAWGCVGIVRACLAAASAHSQTRRQFGRPIADYQLILRHLAQLVTFEHISTQACEAASKNWDSNRPSLAIDAVLAKYVSSRAAADGASTAVQIFASAGAQTGHVVARAYRDAKLMEIIEGSNEICELLIAERALTPLQDNGGNL